MKVTGFKNGCGAYWRLMADGASAPNLLELQEKFREATTHRESCPDCQRLNEPLVQQFFSCPVVVVETKES
jgi:hypothetical protein